MLAKISLLVPIAAFAFTSEATVGFGAGLIAVSLGSLVTPIEAFLPAFLPLNVALSLAVVVRARQSVSWRLLGGRVLPAMAVGFPIGFWAFENAPRTTLQLAFALFVFVLAALELWRMSKGSTSDRPLSPAVATGMLVLGGIVHGAFATGGPPVVYVCGRTLPHKASFRATMSALWLVLNAVLIAAYAFEGRLTMATLEESVLLAPGVVVGLVAGELLHGRIPERAFRIFVFVLLLVVAVVLGARA